MRPGDWLPIGSAALGLVAFTGVAAARPIDPSVVTDAPGPLRAAVAFGLVVVVGAGIQLRYGAFVDRSIDASMERPLSSLVYGVAAFGLVGFGGVLAVVQTSQLGVAVRQITLAGVVVTGAALLLLGSLGYLVLGTRITDYRGERRPWDGLAFGAAVGAVGWLILPPLAAVVVWALGAAVGIGGPMRTWLHADRSVASDGPV